MTRAAWLGPNNFLLVRSEHAHANYPVLFFLPPTFSPCIWGGKKGEFRYWTNKSHEIRKKLFVLLKSEIQIRKILFPRNWKNPKSAKFNKDLMRHFFIRCGNCEFFFFFFFMQFECVYIPISIIAYSGIAYIFRARSHHLPPKVSVRQAKTSKVHDGQTRGRRSQFVKHKHWSIV